jgi:hypothetical protein
MFTKNAETTPLRAAVGRFPAMAEYRGSIVLKDCLVVMVVPLLPSSE